MEELIAEMSAAFTCAEVGIAPAIRDDHAPDLAHWLQVLKTEPRHLWSIASAAQAATDRLATYSTRAAPSAARLASPCPSSPLRQAKILWTVGY